MLFTKMGTTPSNGLSDADISKLIMGRIARVTESPGNVAFIVADRISNGWRVHRFSGNSVDSYESIGECHDSDPLAAVRQAYYNAAVSPPRKTDGRGIERPFGEVYNAITTSHYDGAVTSTIRATPSLIGA